MKTPAENWIHLLDLKPHPEGGYYREVYRSKNLLKQEALGTGFQSDRPYATAIYFLLQGEDFSALHRIKQDELWHFYDGTGLSIHVLQPQGRYEEIKLGKNISSGEQLQAVVPAGNWFGASLPESSGFALVGCTVAPGFSFEDFEMPKQEFFLQTYPEHKELILKLTRK